MKILSNLAKAIGLPSPYPDLASLPEIVESNPSHVWIEPTNRCNTRCRHCEHFKSNFGADMSEELFDHVLTSGILGQVKHIDLAGYGEPLLSPHFDRFLDCCLERGASLSFTTNGILLHNETLLHKLVRLPVLVILSIDGARKETYEFVRPYIKWEKTLQTLDLLKTVADQAGADKRLRLHFNFAAMKQNIGDLPDLVRLAGRYGAQTITLLPLTGESSNAELEGQFTNGMRPEDAPVVFEALQEAARLGVNLILPSSYAIPLRESASWWRKAQLGWMVLRRAGARRLVERALHDSQARAQARLRPCLMPWKDTYIQADGRVVPCCYMPWTLGDVKTEDWPSIWNGPRYRSLRRTTHSWNPTLSCRRCGFVYGINGGDENYYDKFFARYQAEPLPLDRAQFGEGFWPLERTPEGAPSHIWMRRDASFSIPARPGAKFLRLHIIPQSPGLFDFNAGRCTINAQPPEPFDNTCGELHFPLPANPQQALQLHIEMENEFRVGDDPRDLALAIHRIEYLR